MRDPGLEHGETWDDFYRKTLRKLNEIEVAIKSMEWWEREEARSQLSLLWYELEYAREMMGDEDEDDSEAESVEGVQ